MSTFIARNANPVDHYLSSGRDLLIPRDLRAYSAPEAVEKEWPNELATVTSLGPATFHE